MNITKRVIKWNSLRYDQEYDNDLTLTLLDSEVQELADAKGQKVDQVDALCDVIYVSIGAIWKLGLSAKQIDECLNAVCDANDTKVAIKTEAHIKANIDKGPDFVTPESRIEEILNG